MIHWTYIASGIIFLLGIVLFFVLATRRGYRRHPAVEHYREARDQLSGVQVEEEDAGITSTGIGIGGIIGTFISLIVMVGVALPVVSEVTSQVQLQSNVSGTAVETVLNLLPLFIGLAALTMIASLFVGRGDA